jgi:hypothetical protein
VNPKLRLPAMPTDGAASMSESLQKEMHRTVRAKIDADASTTKAQLALAGEGIAAARAVLEVLVSFNNLKAKRTEWKARVAQAELVLERAKIDLEKTREHSKAQMESLQATREILLQQFAFFDEMMAQLRRDDVPEDQKNALREKLLVLSGHLVKLRS